MSGTASSKTRRRAGLALGASIVALAISQNAYAQATPCPDGSTGPVCVIEVTGSSGAITGTTGGATVINNTGTITGAPAVAMGGSSVLFVNNEAAGTINGTSGVAINAAFRLNTVFDNSGTINGNVVVADVPAPSVFTAGLITFVSDGGTVNGDVQLGTSGFTRANFIQRGADDGVTGTISAGLGLDIYTRSYATSQTLTVGQHAMPTTFEIEGYEAFGAGTVLTLNGSGTTINLAGTGSVINNATIGRVDAAPHFPSGSTFVSEAIGYYYPTAGVFRRQQVPLGQPGSFFSVFYGSALTSFTNNGVVTGDVSMSTASFVNTGELNFATSSFGSNIFAKANSAFSFDNQGDITLTILGSRPAGIAVAQEFADGFEAAMRLRSALDTTSAADVSISNSGSVVGGLNGRFAAEDFVFTNSGSIEGTDMPGSYQAAGLVMWVGELTSVIGTDPETHFDAATALFTNTATGSIDHSTELFLSAFDATVINRGFMAGADFSTDAISVEQYLDADDVDATRFVFDNSGMIEGSVELDLQTTTVNITNSGEVTGVGLPVNGNTFPDLLFGGGGVAFRVENETFGDQAIVFTNTGTIETVARAQSGVLLELDSDSEDDEGNLLPPINATVSVVNSGTISATGGATLTGQQFANFLEPNQFFVNPMAALVVDASDVPGAATVTIENQAGGLIRAGGNLQVLTPGGYTPVPNPVNGVFTAALLAAGRTITITNAGTIEGGAGTIIGPNIVLNSIEPRDGFLAGAIQTAGDEYGPDDIYEASRDTVLNTATGVIIGSIDLGGKDDTLTNLGLITGAVIMRDGDDTLVNYGAIEGDLFFGAGNDRFTQGVSAIFTGTADGGEGSDSFVLDLTGGGTIDQTIYDRLVNFELFSLFGQGQVDVDLGDEDDNFENDGTLEGDVSLGAGDNSFANTGTVAGNVTGGGGADAVANEGTIQGSVDLGAGENQFANSGTVTGNVTGGGDADDVSNEGTIEGSVDLGAGANQFANNGTVTGNVTGGSDADDVANEGEIEGSVDLGEGDNQLANNGTITGDVSSGSGADQLDNGGTIVGNVDLGAGANQFTNTGEVEGDVAAGNDDDVLANSGSISGDVFLDEPAEDDGASALASASFRRTTAATIPATTGGDDVFSNTGTLAGNLFAGAGNDAITNSGTIGGDLDLGDGNDTLVLLGAWAIEGSASGGAGTDAVNLTLVGGSTPQSLHMAGFSGFESLSLSGGTGVLADSMTFGQINLTGGRLIGAAGSTITGNVAVSTGATFGSAGQVTGNITVASGATLSPGASPAVMTVTGNVSLAAGSTTLFEFVPAPGQSDQLLIDGNLTIASGATLNLTGNRPLTPGLAYDLIVADTITGQFTLGTWDRSLVQGFLRYVDGANADRLQLFGTFVFQSPAGPAPTAAVNYVNGLLVSGTASAALLAGVNPLLDGATGFASAAAFARLTPEPYASATQLGVETGLGLVRTARSGIGRGTGEEAGLFGFGSGLSTWRMLVDDPGLGTSRTRNRASGVLGGLGFGNRNASLGAFVGHVDARQRISALGAQTNSDGMMAGVVGHVGAGGFNLDALAAYDWSKADTSRSVPGNGSASSNYNLRSLVLGGGLSYDLAMGGLVVTPGVGLTHLSVRRGAASETGSAAYGLNVDADRHAATFIDASISFGETDAGAVRPRLSAGVRHQLEGDLVAASAGLLGSAARFTVPGAPRKDTVITAGAGIEADVGTGITLSAAYDGEFGGGAGSSATLGLRARF